MKIRCAIVDDEYLARQYLREYILKVPTLELAGDFNSPLKVIDLLKGGSVDLLFLDIEMPDISGLDFLRTLRHPPQVIITTAYREYALQGYEVDVKDYLLKPFSFERFLQAVNKIRPPEAPTGGMAANTALTLPHLPAAEDFLIIRADRKQYKINFDDLVYIEGQKAYVSFHTAGQRVTALASLKDLEERLPARQFIRIH